MAAVSIRSVEIFLVLLAVTRCMGKREIGTLQPFEFVLSMIMANLATMPLEEMGIPLWEGILPLVVMLILQVLFSLLGMRSMKFQKLICGQPALVINHGEVNEGLLEALRYSVSDLMSQIRSGGLSGPQEVEYAVLETNGVLNLIPKAAYAQPTRQDLSLPLTPTTLPFSLVENGQIMEESLQTLGKDRLWLDKQLRSKGCNSPCDALYALYLPDGTLALQKRNVPPRRRRIRP